MKRLHTLTIPGFLLGLLAVSAVAIPAAQQASAQTVQTPGSLSDGLTERQRGEAERGRRLFDLRFLPVPSEGLPGGGLGPFYMRSACSACHQDAGRGVLPDSPDTSMFGGAVLIAEPHLAYGEEVNTRSAPPMPHEGDVTIVWDVGNGEFLDGETFSLRVPKITVGRPNYGKPPTGLSLRIAPALAGLGLLESVPDIEILSWADPDDLNGDGVSGRPNWVADPVSGSPALGRFGWKADYSSLVSAVADSARKFMGLTSSLYPDEPCAPTQLECLSQAVTGRADLADGVLRDLTSFVTALRRPIRRNESDPAVLRGQGLFREIGCNACHRERMTTAAAVPGAPYLAGVDIFPYTDLLLHDMGDELDDGRRTFQSETWEWRTPPLWGLGRGSGNSESVAYLHDGRARTLKEAILWHGGEALAARNAFFVLPGQDRDDLIAFLKSL